jgi:hypothetical protein
LGHHGPIADSVAPRGLGARKLAKADANLGALHFIVHNTCHKSNLSIQKTQKTKNFGAQKLHTQETLSVH